MLSDRLTYSLLALIVVAFIVTGALYAIYTPPWQAPDEPAHYNYIAQIVESGCCPIIAPGDWDANYLENLKANQFPDDADLSSIEYADHHPPLYYLAASLTYRVFGGNLIALRILSVLCGAGVVIAAYFATARLLPRQRNLALAVATFVAFVPQHVAIMASVNNDCLAELGIGIILVVAITYLGNPISTKENGEPQPLSESSRPHVAALGGLVGAAFLTKLTLYIPAVLVVTVVILLRWRADKCSLRWLVTQIIWAGGMALIIGAGWWIRNVIIYGWPDFLGQGEHSLVVVGQLRTNELLAEVGFGSYLRQFLTTTYHSFWGQFGWMGVPMPPRVYLLIGIFLVWDVVGVILALFLSGGHPRLEAVQRLGVWAFVALTLATIFNYVYYNLTFVQFQGRYLFTALIPIGLLVVLGAHGWVLLFRRWLKGEGWSAALAWLLLAAVAWLPLLALWALFRYIVPNLG